MVNRTYPCGQASKLIVRVFSSERFNIDDVQHAPDQLFKLKLTQRTRRRIQFKRGQIQTQSTDVQSIAIDVETCKLSHQDLTNIRSRRAGAERPPAFRDQPSKREDQEDSCACRRIEYLCIMRCAGPNRTKRTIDHDFSKLTRGEVNTCRTSQIGHKFMRKIFINLTKNINWYVTKADA
ncbi:hypothetical protein A9Z05_01935 [Burkholderia sp. A2]|nr:hypothetical protein A9Z05_01935 [Burkholderia sp. A2]